MKHRLKTHFSLHSINTPFIYQYYWFSKKIWNVFKCFDCDTSFNTQDDWAQWCLFAILQDLAWVMMPLIQRFEFYFFWNFINPIEEKNIFHIVRPPLNGCAMISLKLFLSDPWIQRIEYFEENLLTLILSDLSSTLFSKVDPELRDIWQLLQEELPNSKKNVENSAGLTNDQPIAQT